MPTERLYRCTKCKADLPAGAFDATYRPRKGRDRRPVVSKCKACRREGRYEEMYPDLICATCTLHRKLDLNGSCPACNEKSGLRQCLQCKDLLPILLSFFLHRPRCKSCEGLGQAG